MSFSSKLTFWKKNTKDELTDTAGFSGVELSNSKLSDETSLSKLVVYGLLILSVICYLIGIYWSSEPEVFKVMDDKAYKVKAVWRL